MLPVWGLGRRNLGAQDLDLPLFSLINFRPQAVSGPRPDQ
jgi:hypothetical protein